MTWITYLVILVLSCVLVHAQTSTDTSTATETSIHSVDNPLIQTIPIQVQSPTQEQHEIISFPIHATSYQHDITQFCTTHGLGDVDCGAVHNHVHNIVQQHHASKSTSPPQSSPTASRVVLILGTPSPPSQAIPNMSFPDTHVISLGAPRVTLHTLEHRFNRWVKSVGDVNIPYTVVWISPSHLSNSSSTPHDITSQFISLHTSITTHTHTCVMVMSIPKGKGEWEDKREQVNEQIRQFAVSSPTTIFINIDGLLKQLPAQETLWTTEGDYTPQAYIHIQNIITNIISERDKHIQHDVIAQKQAVPKVWEQPPASYLHIGGQERQYHMDWDIMDAIPDSHVNYVGDASHMERWTKPVFDIIYASHVLEHFDYQGELLSTLTEWFRILKPGGKLLCAVPDMDIIARLYLNTSYSLSDRFLLMRMLFGGHINQWDYHKVGLNFEFLHDFLSTTGFTNITRVDMLESHVPWHDTSSLRFHDHFISLAVIAYKPV